MIKKNIDKVRSRRCIAGGTVLSLTDFFYVPKGKDNIRLVYDLTASGLNDDLWAPVFCMPLVDNVLDVATHLSWFGDIDAAEIFHNYKMLESMQPYAGVDVSWTKKGNKIRWEKWTRMAMDLVSSPFSNIRIFPWAIEVITGNRKNSLNNFFWDVVIHNPPGTTSYDITMPRLYRWDSF